MNVFGWGKVLKCFYFGLVWSDAFLGDGETREVQFVSNFKFLLGYGDIVSSAVV